MRMLFAEQPVKHMLDSDPECPPKIQVLEACFLI
jgi:hypothetical protein